MISLLTKSGVYFWVSTRKFPCSLACPESQSPGLPETCNAGLSRSEHGAGSRQELTRHVGNINSQLPHELCRI